VDNDNSGDEEVPLHFELQRESRMVDPEKSRQMKTGVFNDADFWYHKGFTTGQKQQMDTALNCYKQAIKIDPAHYPSMFNLACCYEKLGRFSSAKRWFDNLCSIKLDWADAYYGAALSAFKLGKYEETLPRVSKAIGLAEHKSQSWYTFVYLQAVAFKKLKRY